MVFVGGRERGTRRLYVGLAVLALAGVFMAWGHHNPVYRLLQHVPVLNQFRAPGRWLVVWSAGAALLCGLCLDELRARVQAGRSVRGLGVLFGAAGVAGVVALAVLWGRPDRPAGFAGATSVLTPRDWDLVNFSLGAVLAALALVRPKAGSVRWLGALMVVQGMAFSLYDPHLLSAGWSALPPALVGKVPQRAEEGRLAVVMLGCRRDRSGRIVELNAEDGVAPRPPESVRGVVPNTNLLNGVPLFNIYDPLTAPTDLLRKALGARVVSPKVATALGIRQMLTNLGPEDVPGPWRLVARVPGSATGLAMYLYENPAFAGLVFTATRFTAPAQAHDLLQDKGRSADFLLDAPCVIPEPEGIVPTEVRRRARVVQWDSRTIRVEVEDGAPCVLVVASTQAPGWTATVNGAPAELGIANGAFCAVVVPRGSSEVCLRYRPSGVQEGARICAVGLVLLLAGLVVRRRR
jgi:hypothetical protein